MAEYKIVNSEQLDADLKDVADSIRVKNGTTEELTFPNDFKSAINNIDTSKEEQIKSITASTNGAYTITPDDGKVLSAVTVNVDAQKEEQTKSIMVYEDGEWTILPDDGKVLSSVNVKCYYANLCQSRHNVDVFSPETVAIVYPEKGKLMNMAYVDYVSMRSMVNNLFSAGYYLGYSELRLPDWIKSLRSYAFYGTGFETVVVLGEMNYIYNRAFGSMSNLQTVTFQQKVTNIMSDDVFIGCDELTTINVPWSEGEVAYAPWGATNATINYNYTEG